MLTPYVGEGLIPYTADMTPSLPPKYLFITAPDEEEGPIAQTAYTLGVECITGISGSDLHAKDSTLVFLNGNLLGVHRRPRFLVRMFRSDHGSVVHRQSG